MDGGILLKKDEPGIIYAVTLVQFSDNTASYSEETNIEGKTFANDVNASYRLICDIKNQLEILRAKAFDELNVEFEDGAEEEEDDKFDR